MEPGTDDRQQDVTTDELVTAWGLLSEAVVAVTRRLASGLDTAGHLGLTEFDVVIRLHREPGRQLPLHVIANEVGLSPAGLTRLVNRMELDGLVTTSSDSSTRAVIQVALTEHGEARTVAALGTHTEDLHRHLLDPLGADGLRVLAQLARRLRDTRPDGYRRSVFALVVRFDLPDPAAAATFDRLVEQIVPTIVDAEPGTLVYATHRVIGAPLSRIFYEVYRDRAALDEHEARPATAAFLAQVRALEPAVRVEEVTPDRQ